MRSVCMFFLVLRLPNTVIDFDLVIFSSIRSLHNSVLNRKVVVCCLQSVKQVDAFQPSSLVRCDLLLSWRSLFLCFRLPVYPL
mmetsp:Transcript_3735/g.9224  ORF Transcript_3735/g.9224 Transcript_3735/m.9224 type:complete len:83 (-) Transcript_3735:28-276(-)